MFTKSMSHKEADFVSHVDSNSANLKEKIVKELNKDLISNITNAINK